MDTVEYHICSDLIDVGPIAACRQALPALLQEVLEQHDASGGKLQPNHPEHEARLQVMTFLEDVALVEPLEAGGWKVTASGKQAIRPCVKLHRPRRALQQLFLQGTLKTALRPLWFLSPVR